MTQLPAGATWHPAPSSFTAADGRPTIALVLPGGGYSMHAPHEGVGYLPWLHGAGIGAVVFAYPIAPHRHPEPVVATRALLSAMRSGTVDGLPRDARIVVVGSSAGGHLATLLASAPTPAEQDAGGDTDRPDAVVLCYPVTSMTEQPHRGSVDALLGGESSIWTRATVDAYLLVDGMTPPTFLWHTADDGGVHVAHSLDYARALSRRRIPFELHVFECGEHGAGLATGVGPVEAWSDLATRWLEDRGLARR
ncbi:alpha/beta hydrolase [Curtobacterium sp. 9128]|uniref:alpha/beta hydrolase n=1 Tax=Curtobacterium sp. 9128 TaxID=1793722 RepID=UPI0011A84C8C|nr:alpha/beta hydrolase [Curtobacterium sp. 9128]